MKGAQRKAIDKEKHSDYIVTLLVDGQSAKNARELKLVSNAQSDAMAVRALMCDPAIVQLCTQFRCHPVSVSIAGAPRRIAGTCSKCGSLVLEGSRLHQGRDALLCEECGPDCVAAGHAPPWLGEGLEETGDALA